MGLMRQVDGSLHLSTTVYQHLQRRWLWQGASRVQQCRIIREYSHASLGFKSVISCSSTCCFYSKTASQGRFALPLCHPKRVCPSKNIHEAARHASRVTGY